jgi:hypothetical protein|uniref:LEM-like protein n=1 Tax=Siphoviridae sp. ctR0j7 TaxID=2823580 RepID=A0A8S5LHB5_9CAUD|nr:HeH/LEM domain-containing protein [uncultured Kingella sp.]DAD69493.1 MAG TPA: LEM-like protein [Siphoviridae sp. ctR0j7]DAR50290.1 MAG TPA: hypothetical protein [Caudoviricetes sp.]
MLIKNIKPAVVVLNGMTVLAPMQEAEVADNDAGVLSLVESGHLEVLEQPKSEPSKQEDVTKMTVEQLRQYLTEKGVEFASDAKKENLLALAGAQ